MSRNLLTLLLGSDEVVMSEDVDTLLSIAEIAGVFVGFATLLTFIRRRAELEDRSRDAYLLASVVLISVMVIVATLVPVALNRYGLSELIVWRVSSGVFFILNWINILFTARATQGFRAVHSQRRALAVTVWSLEPLLQISLLFCIIGVWKSVAGAFYITALSVSMIQVSLVFSSLVVELLKADQA